MKSIIKISILTITVTTMFFTSCTQKTENNHEGMLIIKDQGSFTVGGTVVQHPGQYDSQKFNNWQPYEEGQTFHGDHAYVFYQIPDKAKQLPIVFLHGAGQSAQTWETTADGREGFQNIFLRRGFSTYLVDQPRRGRAGRSTVAATLEPIAYEPGTYLFPQGELPETITGRTGALNGVEVPMEQFNKLLTLTQNNLIPFPPLKINKIVKSNG